MQNPFSLSTRYRSVWLFRSHVRKGVGLWCAIEMNHMQIREFFFFIVYTDFKLLISKSCGIWFNTPFFSKFSTKIFCFVLCNELYTVFFLHIFSDENRSWRILNDSKMSDRFDPGILKRFFKVCKMSLCIE
jgi:hypothetical protein